MFFVWVFGSYIGRLQLRDRVVAEIGYGQLSIFTGDGVDMMRSYVMSGHPPPFPKSSSTKILGFSFARWDSSARYLIAAGWKIDISLLYLLFPTLIPMAVVLRNWTRAT